MDILNLERELQELQRKTTAVKSSLETGQDALKRKQEELKHYTEGKKTIDDEKLQLAQDLKILEQKQANFGRLIANLDGEIKNLNATKDREEGDLQNLQREFDDTKRALQLARQVANSNH